mgnify:CR=1 FL=1
MLSNLALNNSVSNKTVCYNLALNSLVSNKTVLSNLALSNSVSNKTVSNMNYRRVVYSLCIAYQASRLFCNEFEHLQKM